MENRFAAAATGALLAVAGLTACSSPPSLPPQPPGALPPRTAHVTIDGQDAGTTHDVSCTQVGWSNTFSTGDKDSGTTAVVNTGDQITAESVQIRNLNGFTGSFTAGTYGNAEATVAGQTFTITGTALGYTPDKPTNQVPQHFTIKVSC
ncbi:lipoprotein LpqH [Mycobacterium sp.]|uniref:lipoprotein LpqH n=1 Tax=Mycobacterium sp. TaxID=1785 RepID=UPI002BAC2F22|nr:lipoprotein LpqH [Mycobacterium sp.]HME49256.1 lipoprotein LpqH [Mycobacterium sp.]